MEPLDSRSMVGSGPSQHGRCVPGDAGRRDRYDRPACGLDRTLTIVLHDDIPRLVDRRRRCRDGGGLDTATEPLALNQL